MEALVLGLFQIVIVVAIVVTAIKSILAPIHSKLDRIIALLEQRSSQSGA